MAPTLRWGLATGILVALVDAVSLVAARGVSPDSQMAQYIATADQVINVILFSIAGIRVGRATGVVRSAAEAGVLAGTIAGLAAVASMLIAPDPTAGSADAQQFIQVLALNVAMGGILALLNGWIASRAPAGAGRR